MSKKILLTGGSGQLGTHLQKLKSYICPTHQEMDITSLESVIKALDFHNPDLIVHAAAYTNVTKPERSPLEAHKCYETNVLGTRNIIKAAHTNIIFISSETVLHPYNFYALTKLQAENEIKNSKYPYTIMRTSFRCDPFEYDMAPDDMFTIGDSIQIIAQLIDKAIELPQEFKTIYVGTGIKTMYELAIKTRPDVKRVCLADIKYPLAHMFELFNVS